MHSWKESEYGVQGIKAPLYEASVKAEEVYGPALGGREKEEIHGKPFSYFFRQESRPLRSTGASLQDARSSAKDYETLVEEYTRARKYANEARSIVENASYRRVPLTDAEIHTIIVTARMWADVEHQIDSFRRDALRRLTGMQFQQAARRSRGQNPERSTWNSLPFMLETPAWKRIPSGSGFLAVTTFLKNKITAILRTPLKLRLRFLRRDSC